MCRLIISEDGQLPARYSAQGTAEAGDTGASNHRPASIPRLANQRTAASGSCVSHETRLLMHVSEGIGTPTIWARRACSTSRIAVRAAVIRENTSDDRRQER